MQFSITSLLLALTALSTASVIHERQNGGRVIPTGACCVINISVKQDTCTTAAGGAGRCVPGGNASNLQCDALIIERGKSLCRAKTAGGFIHGASVITSLSQAMID